MMETVSTELTLVSLAGPEPKSVELRAPGPITIGRASHHPLSLNDTRVSRDHAVLSCAPTLDGTTGATQAEWRIADTNSRHGTWLNGLRLTPGRPLPLREGDRVLIAPWTFQVLPAGQKPQEGLNLATIADSPLETVSQIDERVADALAQERLALLLRCANALHSAPDEESLAESIVDAASTGTGFANVALLRATATVGEVGLIAHRGQILGGGSALLSRSLLEEASRGTPARLVRREDSAAPAVSIVELGIEEALCVPILLEGLLAGYLYLDNRGGRGARVVGDAAGFAIGLSRLAALAWANLRRVEAERRSARMEAELSAAGRMQSLLLPPREGAFGPFRYVGQSRPGRYVGGDFFDVIPLPDDRIAVAVGDVSGKGVEAAVLITATQGFLHAALLDHGDPGRAMTELNRYAHPRSPAGKFITLWIAVLDAKRGEMHAVDAGHGHAFFLGAGGSLAPVPLTKSFPVCIVDDTQYTAHTLPLRPDASLLVLSDGLIEEPAAGRPGESDRERRARQFSVEGVRGCLTSLAPGEDEIRALFEAVQRHAENEQLADDATAVLVRWS